MAAGDIEVNLITPQARKCASFDGTDDSVNTKANIDLSKPFSLCCWVKRRLNGTNQAIINKGANIQWNFHTDNKVLYRSSAISSYSTSAVLVSEGWVHISVCYDGSAIKFYKNGVADGSVTRSVADTDANFTIGSYTGTSNFFKGFIRDVRIFNRCVSPTEMAQIYAGKNITDGLTNRWKLREDYVDDVTGIAATNDGTSFKTIDTALGNAVAADRTTANDKYLITEMNGKIMNVVVEEAP